MGRSNATAIHMRRKILGMPPCYGWRANESAERTIECRLGFVSNASGYFADSKGTFSQKVSC